MEGEDALLVCRYDPRSPQEFAILAQRAEIALDGLAVTIEHVGSTAVPGLPAKPVIDLDVAVRSTREIGSALVGLARVGYRAEERTGVVSTIDGLTAPRWPHGERRHHLYIVVADSPIQRQRLVFRDYLRTHPAEAHLYGEIKTTAANQADGDWEQYARIKHDFIQRMLRRTHAQ